MKKWFARMALLSIAGFFIYCVLFLFMVSPGPDSPLLHKILAGVGFVTVGVSALGTLLTLLAGAVQGIDWLINAAKGE